MNAKYILSLLLLILLSATSFAQCPYEVHESSTKEYISFLISTDDCEIFPTEIDIDGIPFRKVYCDGEWLEYIIKEGEELESSQSFRADMQFNICEYLDGALKDSIIDLQINFLEGVSVFPNPVNFTDFVVLKFDRDLTVDITVVDVTGKVVLQNHIDKDNKIHLDVKHLTTGLYIINMVSDGSSITKKLIVR